MKGFSLIELLIVIFVSGIILSIGIPAFRMYQPTLELSGTARGIMADLRYAEQLAVASQVDHGIRFSSTTNEYWVIKFSDPEETVKSKELPNGVVFSSISGFTNDEVKYNPYGAAVEEGTIILIGENSETKTILVKPSGFVKISN